MTKNKLKILKRYLRQVSPLPWSYDDGNLFSVPLSKERERIIVAQIESRAVNAEHPDRDYEPHSMGYLGTFPQDTDKSDENSECVAAVMSVAPELITIIERLCSEVVRLGGDPDKILREKS